MGKQRAPLEFNRLNGGIITEASPLTFPDNASLDEVNFELQTDGTRRRRFGFDFEANYVLENLSTYYATGSPKMVNTYLWENVAGINSVSYVVVQTDNVVHFYKAQEESLSSGILSFKVTFNSAGYAGNAYDFASIDGALAIVTGAADITVVTADLEDQDNPVFTTTQERLTTRDLFGVAVTYDRSEDVGGAEDVVELTDPAYYATRPVEEGLSSVGHHKYNLRNQTFATPRLPKTGTTSGDPIEQFFDEASKYPATSDTVISSLYANTEDDDNKTANRFHAEDLIENPLGTAPAPKGYFIIDALERSASRQARWAELVEDNGYSDEVVELPVDITPGGASAVAEYGGRLWYGGFSEQGRPTEQGDTRLESYLLYSQLANNKRVVTRCYQAGDPTSITDPELLETDGGFLSLDGAYGISKMIPVGNSLLVFAENGIWALSGLDGNYFTPTSPRVQKITDKGCVSPQAVVVIDTSLIYWAKSGIYAIQYSQAGTYEVENLVDKTVQAMYDEIPYESKTKAVGTYDSFSNEVFWLVYNTVARERETEVIVLKTNSGAFTKYKIEDNITPYTTLAGYAKIPPYVLRTVDETVTVEGEVVVTDITTVITTAEPLVEERNFDTKGIVIHSEDGNNNLTFGEFNNSDFLDWGATDAEAYMVTGYVSGGDLQRVKQTPYVTLHFTRTEDGFYADENSDLQLSRPSGCLVQAQWDWANSANSGRWSREFQAYRYPRHYMPADVNDPFDTGFATITTRNKIRGKGRVLSLKLRTEEGKDCRVLGWSTIMGVQDGL